MSERTEQSNERDYKTLAIRLPNPTHAKLTLLAQVEGTTQQAVMLAAIEAHVERLGTNPDLAAKAQALLDEIDQEAKVRREAITSLLGNPSGESPTSGANRRGRSSG